MLEPTHHPLRRGGRLILGGTEMGIGAEPITDTIDREIMGEAGGQVVR
ncbi:MAG: hypothetical protein ACOYK7_15450 [Pirellulales bacterium]